MLGEGLENARCGCRNGTPARGLASVVATNELASEAETRPYELGEPGGEEARGRPGLGEMSPGRRPCGGEMSRGGPGLPPYEPGEMSRGRRTIAGDKSRDGPGSPHLAALLPDC